MNVKKLFRNFVLFTAFMPFTLLSAFTPEDYSSADDTFYLEIAPARTNIAGFRAFFKGLVGAPADNLWEMGTTQLKNELGYNPFSAEELAGIGFDPDSKMSITGKIESTAEGQLKPDFIRIYLPAKDSKTLYSTLITKAKEEIPSYEGDTEAGESPVEEHIKNKLFEIKDPTTSIFIMRGKDFVVIANTKLAALNAGKKPSEKITKAEWYKKINTRFAEKKPAANAILYLNPSEYFTIISKFYTSFYSANSAAMGTNIDSKILTDMMQEFAENTEALGGYSTIGGHGLSFYFNEEYKPGYLQKKNTFFTRFYNAKADYLATDKYYQLPVLYTVLKVNFPGYFEMIKESSPELRASLTQGEEEFKEKTGLDLEKDVIQSIIGNFSLVIGSIPAEQQMRDFNQWNGHFSFGIAKNSQSKFEKIIDQIGKEEDAKSAELKSFTMSKKKSSGDLLYTFDVPQKNSATPQTIKVFLNLQKDQVLISSNNADLQKLLKSSKTPLPSRLSAEKGDYISYFFVDLEKIITYLKSSSMAVVMAQYIQFVQNLDKLEMYSTVDGDSTNSSVQLKLLQN